MNWLDLYSLTRDLFSRYAKVIGDALWPALGYFKTAQSFCVLSRLTHLQPATRSRATPAAPSHCLSWRQTSACPCKLYHATERRLACGEWRRPRTRLRSKDSSFPGSPEVLLPRAILCSPLDQLWFGDSCRNQRTKFGPLTARQEGCNSPHLRGITIQSERTSSKTLSLLMVRVARSSTR